VIECGRLPRCRIVTLHARVIELINRMVRIGRAGEVALVARVAVPWCAGILTVHVALIAGDRRMCTG
jgi:hypothetical protein